MNQMIQPQNQEIIYNDIYPEIKEDKINLIFILSDNTRKYIKIPSSLRKNELYLVAERFRKIQYSDIALYYKGHLLDNNESTIEFISNGDSINVSEILDIDYNYYNKLLSKKSKNNFYNVILETLSGIKMNKTFPKETTTEEIIKSFLSIMKIPIKLYLKQYYIRYNGITLRLEDKNVFNEEIPNVTIIFFECMRFNIRKGKKLLVTIKKENEILTDEFFVGTLELLKCFYEELKSKLNRNHYKLIDNPIIIPGDIELKKDDERTFSSIGIRENFICKVKVEYSK